MRPGYGCLYEVEVVVAGFMTLNNLGVCGLAFARDPFHPATLAFPGIRRDNENFRPRGEGHHLVSI